ncbi:hypothetical protein GGX14DRAFT_394363 [Mycena pura]|uniref:TonB C-terminal domain-containing protein n=1 Tax=Mycena pura TaxID=153505 RepID=A0AAD6VGG6_9AGAR|nr:hypothetical protein GGX14DRAFT_394363 [Mycena pura]
MSSATYAPPPESDRGTGRLLVPVAFDISQRWEPQLPSLEDEGTEGNMISGVDALFQDVERRITEEKGEESDMEDDEGELPEAPMLARSGRPKKPTPPSLMKKQLYNFALVKAALDCVVPVEEVEKVDVVRKQGNG